MRIVSQERNLSVVFDNCELWMQGTVIYRRIGQDSKVLGVYATSERAAEVFEDIHMAYAPVYSISNNMSEDELRSIFLKSKNIAACNILEFGEGKSLTTYSEYVYYMPEK